MASVGRLLADYSELEISLMHCVSVRRKDLDLALKTMFRVRGESKRIDLADALGRLEYRSLGIESLFDDALNAMRYSLRIRNKFAHSYWHAPGNGLCYVSLEDLAKENFKVIDLTNLDFFFLDQSLLDKHEEFYGYTLKLISFVNFEGRTLAGEFKSNPTVLPTALKQPPLFTRVERH